MKFLSDSANAKARWNIKIKNQLRRFLKKMNFQIFRKLSYCYRQYFSGWSIPTFMCYVSPKINTCRQYDNHAESANTRVGTLIVATIYLQLIQNRYMFRSFTVLQCSHQHCVQPVASDVEVVGYL